LDEAFDYAVPALSPLEDKGALELDIPVPALYVASFVLGIGYFAKDVRFFCCWCL